MARRKWALILCLSSCSTCNFDSPCQANQRTVVQVQFVPLEGDRKGLAGKKLIPSMQRTALIGVQDDPRHGRRGFEGDPSGLVRFRVVEVRTACMVGPVDFQVRVGGRVGVGGRRELDIQQL